MRFRCSRAVWFWRDSRSGCTYSAEVMTFLPWAAVKALLISTYELGHQPLQVASPAEALRVAGHEVRCLDLAVEEFDWEAVRWAEVVAFSVPMHTAMRLAVQAAGEVRAAYPEIRIGLYGLYAAVGRDRSVGVVADRVIVGEYEQALVAWLDELERGRSPDPELTVELSRTRFHLPARDLLPPLESYAHLLVAGEHRLVGYVEASHGCRHRCRHCPIPAVYDGRLRVVQPDVVLSDVEQLVAMGARHITFGDPDFLNGVHHSMRVVREVHSAFPDLTLDITTKVEHILAHPEVWSELARSGLLFVVSAFETTNDEVLLLLDKGHTAADEADAVHALRAHGVEIRPSWLPFTPWTTLGDLVDMFDFIIRHDLRYNIDPVQMTIRLVIPEGSLLLDLPEILPYLGEYDSELLTWRWQASDPEIDLLQARLAELVEGGVEAGEDPGVTFERLHALVAEGSGLSVPAAQIPAGATEGRPRLTEPWFC